MKPPPRDDIDTSADAGLLEDLASAVRAGRLVGFLKGKGLTRSTVEELLRPESAARLKAILTDHMLPELDRGALKSGRKNGVNDPGHEPADSTHQGGKVLAYHKQETCKP